MNLANAFRGFGQIYGICPCCGELFRLSEARVFTPSLPVKTPFDEVAENWLRLDLQVERFEAREARVRAEARLVGQRAARRRLRSIVPFFLKRRVDPNDVKVLFTPVHYVAFRGMTDRNCSSVDFIDTPAVAKQQEVLQESMFQAISAGRMAWWTLRIDEDGRVSTEMSL